MSTNSKSRYLIIGGTRSGTTLTHLTLLGHPNISALTGELQPSPFFNQGIKIFTPGYCSEKEWEHGFSAIFESITTINEKDNTIANGAKIACNSYKTVRRIANILQKYLKDIKIIHVVRKDLVAQFGSAYSGKKSGIMHSWSKGFKDRKIERIRIRKWHFISYMINSLERDAEMKELGKTHEIYEMVYEDYLRNQRKINQELFEFLGVPNLEVTWLESKKVMPPPEKYIQNYQKMKELQSNIEIQYLNNGISPYILYTAKILNKVRYIFRFYGRLKR